MRHLEVPDDGTQYDRDCVLYLRKSKGKAGIARQRKESQAHAKKLRWRIVAEAIDVDATAFTKLDAEEFARRDDYLLMLEMLRNDTRGVPLGVLGWHADRLHRNPEEVGVFIRVCAAGPHPVETPMSGGYDLSTAIGIKRIVDDANAAWYEVAHLIERVVNHKAEAARQGRWLGGKVPWGWRRLRIIKDDGDGDYVTALELHEERAAAIEWGSRAVLDGASMYAIEREWNRRGLTRFGGGPWTAREVRQILLRPRNAGLQVYQGKIIETEREDGKGDWPPIVDEELWRAVQRILMDPARRTSPGPTPRWLGSGLYLCGVCGAPMRGGARSGGLGVQKPIYRCRVKGDGRTHVTRDAASLDAYVEALVYAWFTQPDLAEILAEEKPPDLDEIRARLGIQEAELRDWRRLAREQKVSAVAFAENEQAVLDRITGIKDELARAVRSPLLADVLASGDVEAYLAGREGDLAWWRAVVDRLMTVTVHQVEHKGRPAGLRPGQPYFDPDSVEVEWKKPAAL